MSTADRHIVLGRIGAAHGVKGDVRVKSFAAEPTALGDYGLLSIAGGRTLAIERMRPLKGDMLVVKFRGVDDRDAAEALNGAEFSVKRSALPAPDADEFYHADLIGLAAYDETGEAMGTVKAVLDFGAGASLEIADSEGGLRLVPFTNEAVPTVDIAGGRIIVAPPAGIEGEKREPEGGDAS